MSGRSCSLFIHQQIQSFLNLGVCKEYSIMAKLRLPKKTNDPVASTTASPVPTVSATTAGPIAQAVPTPEAQQAATKKTEAKKVARKPEIVRSEPRANLVPINIDDEIRRLAYLLSERRGCEPGHEAEDWTAAER